MSIKIQETGHGFSMAHRIGTINDVIGARISSEISSKKLKATDFSYGFELASPQDAASLGEAVIVNGKCYATSTDKTTPEYHQVISGEEFVTGGLFCIPHAAKPSHHVSLTQGASSLSFNDFYLEVSRQINSPFAFAGLFHFEALHAIALSKPPIGGQNIFENKSEYYANPEIYEKDVEGFVIGIVTQNQEVADKDLQTELETILYRNPLDAESKLIHHAHLVTLKKHIRKIEEITPEIVDKCLHLFIDGSQIDSMQADIYSINRVTEWK